MNLLPYLIHGQVCFDYINTFQILLTKEINFSYFMKRASLSLRLFYITLQLSNLRVLSVLCYAFKTDQLIIFVYI